jgi:sporulation protein YlmC with PRC-barrel domain
MTRDGSGTVFAKYDRQEETIYIRRRSMRVQRFSAFVLGGLWSLFFLGTVQAQGPRIDVNRRGVDVEVGGRRLTAAAESKGPIVRARNLTGLSVYNPDHESLGKIEDLVIDPQSGRIRYAVLSFGGILGMGDKYFAIPWRKLSFVFKGETSAGTQKEDHCVLDLPKDTLKNAPGFNKDYWLNFADQNWRQTVEQYYQDRREATERRMPRR